MIAALAAGVVLFATVSDRDESDALARFHLLHAMGDLEGAYAVLVETMRPRDAVGFADAMVGWVGEARSLDELSDRLNEYLIARNAYGTLLRACSQHEVGPSRNKIRRIRFVSESRSKTAPSVISPRKTSRVELPEVQLPVFAEPPAGLRAMVSPDRDRRHSVFIISWDATRVLAWVERKPLAIPLESATFVGPQIGRTPEIR